MSQSVFDAPWERDARREKPQASSESPPARPTNIARSLFHLTSAAIGVTTVTLLPSHLGVILIAVAFATYAWSMEIARRIFPRLNDRLMRFYRAVAHPHEWYRVNSATWYATALVLLALFSARPATLAALSVLGVADPIAAFVGRRWGTRQLRAGRSLEGSLAFVASGAVAAVVGLLLGGERSVVRIALLALLAGVVGGLAELFSTKLDDNLTIPVSVGAVLTVALALF